MSKTNYQLMEQKAAQRVAELSAGDTGDLRAELGLAKFMLENCVGNGASPAAISLLQVIAKLSHQDIENRKRMGTLLDREEIHKFAQSLCAIVIEELQGIEGHEEIIDRIADRLLLLEKCNNANSPCE